MQVLKIILNVVLVSCLQESSWKDLIDIDIRNTMSKRSKELQEGIWELLATEAKYIKQIRVIIDVSVLLW